MGFRWPLNPWKCNPALRGLTPRERWEIERQLLGWVTSGADPIGLALLAAPSCIMILVVVILPEPSSVAGNAGWLAGFILLFWFLVAVLRRRLVRKFLERVRCRACGGGFTQSHPGELGCASGHWTGLDKVWPARHAPPPLDWKLGPLRVTSAREHRRYQELNGFGDGDAALLLSEAKAWASKSLGRAGIGAMILGYITGFATLALLSVTALSGLSLLGLPRGRVDGLVMVVISAAVIVAGIVGLASARAVVRSSIRAAVRRRLDTSVCGQCGYSLKEIPPGPGGVRCPECGAFTPFIPRVQQPAS